VQLSGRSIGKVLGALVLGLVIGGFGTVVHRSIRPWGVVLALVLVLTVGVLVRAWGGYGPLAGYGLGVLAAVQVLAQTGPGGDVLVPAHQTISWVWVVGSPAMVVVAALAPRRWFADARVEEPSPAEPAAGAPGWPAVDEPRP